MGGKYIIGVDIGTQGTKAALFDQAGKCFAISFHKSDLYTPVEGVVEENPERQVLTVCHTISECVKRARISKSAIAAIGIDGQMAGILGVGKDGINVTPYDSWLDTRCAPYIAKMEKAAGAQILNKTGNAPSFNHGPKILWWMHERKSTFKKIKSFVQPGGYAAMRLCGLDTAEAFIDGTYLHFSGFADNRKNRWDQDLCKKFKLDPSKLPEIVEPNKVIGELTSSMARKCDLKAGVPVIAGCGDTAASFLACGATREGVCVDVAGTASVFAATTKNFKADKKNRILGCGQAVVKGLWHPYAYINGGGMNLEWFRKEIANCGLKSRFGEITFQKLNEMAENVIADESPLFIPHLAGRVCPSQPHLRGAWVGLKWHHTISHLYKAVLEGIALEYGIYCQILSQMYPCLKISEVRITGGGEKSAVWNQMKSNVFQSSVVQLTRTEGAPMGVAILAGFGVGLFKSLDSVSQKWVAKAIRYRPDRQLADLYSARIKKYNHLISVLNTFNEKI